MVSDPYTESMADHTITAPSYLTVAHWANRDQLAVTYLDRVLAGLKAGNRSIRITVPMTCLRHALAVVGTAVGPSYDLGMEEDLTLRAICEPSETFVTSYFDADRGWVYASPEGWTLVMDAE